VDLSVHFISPGLRHPHRADVLSSCGQLLDQRDVELTVQREGDRPRNWSSAHDKEVNLLAFLFDQRALYYTEAVLLVDYNEPQCVERYVFLDESVCSQE